MVKNIKDHLNGLSVRHLREIVKTHNMHFIIKGYYKMNKEALIGEISKLITIDKLGTVQLTKETKDLKVLTTKSELIKFREALENKRKNDQIDNKLLI